MIPNNFDKMSEQERIDWWKGLTEEQRQYIAGVIAGAVERMAKQIREVIIPAVQLMANGFVQAADNIQKGLGGIDWAEINQMLKDANAMEGEDDNK